MFTYVRGVCGGRDSNCCSDMNWAHVVSQAAAAPPAPYITNDQRIRDDGTSVQSTSWVHTKKRHQKILPMIELGIFALGF